MRTARMSAAPGPPGCCPACPCPVFTPPARLPRHAGLRPPITSPPQCQLPQPRRESFCRRIGMLWLVQAKRGRGARSAQFLHIARWPGSGRAGGSRGTFGSHQTLSDHSPPSEGSWVVPAGPLRHPTPLAIGSPVVNKGQSCAHCPPLPHHPPGPSRVAGEEGRMEEQQAHEYYTQLKAAGVGAAAAKSGLGFSAGGAARCAQQQLFGWEETGGELDRQWWTACSAVITRSAAACCRCRPPLAGAPGFGPPVPMPPPRVRSQNAA